MAFPMLGFLLKKGKNMENSIIISTEEFLTDLYGSLHVPIYFNVNKKTWWEKPQTYLTARNKLRWRNNQKEDICFIVNSGGSKNEQITDIRAAFIDWDCGRDENDKYFPIEIVRIKKQEFLTKLLICPHKPSYIIETRNGYHVYWILTDNPTRELYITLQNRLIYYFNSDPSVKKPAQVMRLPNYDWCKNSCEPFFVYIFYRSGLKYSSSSLLSSFPAVPDSKIDTLIHNNILSFSSGKKEYTSDNKAQNTVSENHTPVEPLEKGISGIDPDREPRFGAQVNINNNKEYTSSIYLGTYPLLSQEPVIVNTYGEGIEYIKKQNIADYLVKQNIIALKETEYQNKDKISIRCPLHNDTTPSASIYRRESDGYFMLKCHSTKCGFGPASIIDVVQKIYKIPQLDALKLLIGQYHVKIDESWKDEYREILEQNIITIENIGQYKDKYPNLYRCIHRIKGDLISKLVFAIEHIALLSTTGEPMFICSLLEFEKARTGLLTEDYGRQNERIDRYCLLGLLRKLPDDEITNGILFNAYERRKKIQKINKISNMARTQIYTFPEYNDVILMEANQIAEQVKTRGIRMNSISWDVAYEIFGEKKAKEMYPQRQFSGLTKNGESFKEHVESVLLEDMGSRGYSRVSEIVDRLRQNFNWSRVTDRRVKKYIPGLLVKHDLMEIYSNKTIKVRVNILDAGYPRIIIRRDLLLQEERVAG